MHIVEYHYHGHIIDVQESAGRYAHIDATREYHKNRVESKSWFRRIIDPLKTSVEPALIERRRLQLLDEYAKKGSIFGDQADANPGIDTEFEKYTTERFSIYQVLTNTGDKEEDQFSEKLFKTDDKSQEINVDSKLFKQITDEILKPLITQIKQYQPYKTEEIRKKIYEVLKKDKSKDIKKLLKANSYNDQSQFFVSNLVELATNIVNQELYTTTDPQEIETIVDQLISDQRIHLFIGKADSEIKTEMNGWVNKFMNNSRQFELLKKVGLNPIVVGALASGAVSLLTGSTIRRAINAGSWGLSLASAGTTIAAGAVAGGVAGGIKRYGELKTKKYHANAEHAIGMEADTNNKDQAIVEKSFVGSAETANDLIKKYQDLLMVHNDPSELIMAIADIRTRMDLSSDKKRNLITYSSKTAAAKERFELLRTIHSLKNVLKSYNLPTFQIQQLINDASAEMKNILEADIKKANDEYNGASSKAIVAHAGIGAGYGALGAVGLIAVRETGDLLSNSSLPSLSSPNIGDGIKAILKMIPGIPEEMISTGETPVSPPESEINVNSLKDLYNNDQGEIQFGNGYRLVVDKTYTMWDDIEEGPDKPIKAAILDASGQKITPPMKLGPQGDLIMSVPQGQFDIPEEVRSQLKDIKISHDKDLNLLSRFKTMGAENVEAGIAHNDINIAFGGANENTAYMGNDIHFKYRLDWDDASKDIYFHGELNETNGTVIVDPRQFGNEYYNADQHAVMINQLKSGGWTILLESNGTYKLLPPIAVEIGTLNPENMSDAELSKLIEIEKLLIDNGGLKVSPADNPYRQKDLLSNFGDFFNTYQTPIKIGIGSGIAVVTTITLLWAIKKAKAVSAKRKKAKEEAADNERATEQPNNNLF